MHREYATLCWDARSDMGRPVYARVLYLERTAFVVPWYISEPTNAIDDAISRYSRLYHSKVCGNEHALCPVKKAGRHAVMLSDG